MEMPVICTKCNEIVELNTKRESNLTKQLLCDCCASEENQIQDWLDEIEDIQYDLDNNEEYMKGDRRGWKKNIKELKNKIKQAGYSAYL